MNRKVFKLFLGTSTPHSAKGEGFYIKQIEIVRNIWHNKLYNDFGIERGLRLILAVAAFIAPGGMIKFLIQNQPLIIRKIAVELFAILKVALPVFVFFFDLNTNFSLLVITIVLAADTMLYLLSKLFLSDVFSQSVSYKRSLIITFINYIEMCLCFAFIYSYMDYSNPNPVSNPIFHINKELPSTNDGHLSNPEVIYFSFVTAATIGYGDITPIDSLVMKVIVIQIVVSLFFVVVFISNIINRLQEQTYFNLKKKDEDDESGTL